MSLDRIKSQLVSGLTSALLGASVNHARSNTANKKLEIPVKHTYEPPLWSISKSLSSRIPLLDISHDNANFLRRTLEEAQPKHSDSVEVVNIKLAALHDLKGQMDKMPKRSGRKVGVQQVQLSGRGAYGWRNFGGDIVTGLGTGAGGLAGASLGGGPMNPAGAAYGGAVGTTLGGTIGRELGNAIFGRGAYTVQKNSISKAGVVLAEGTEVPSFRPNDRFTRISHREFVQDIVVPVAPTAFTNVNFVINPGNAQLFPWLSTIAAAYQQYEFMGMVVHFKSTSTDFSTSGALGAVIMATNYDVLESPFPNKIIMENAQYSVSAKPSLSQLHAIECDPRMNVNAIKYIQNFSSSTTVSQDARFYHHGLLQLATQGLSSAAGQVLGELWVTYDVKLYKPEIVNIASLTSGQRVSGNANITKANIYGDTPIVFGSQLVTTTANTITFTRPGQYLLDMNMGGNTILSPVMSGTAPSRTQLNVITNAPPQTHFTFIVSATAAGQTLTLDFTTSTGVTATELRIGSYLFANG